MEIRTLLRIWRGQNGICDLTVFLGRYIIVLIDEIVRGNRRRLLPMLATIEMNLNATEAKKLRVLNVHKRLLVYYNQIKKSKNAWFWTTSSMTNIKPSFKFVIEAILREDFYEHSTRY